MRTNPILSCVIPAYNEAENLPKFIPALVEKLEQQHLAGYEIIVIDDGSKDKYIDCLGWFSRAISSARIGTVP